MSLQALAQEKFWANKAECEDAEKAYHMRLSGAKILTKFGQNGSRRWKKEEK
jgi:hypothetical protein